MTQKILIIAIPPGEAPEWVREQWVGLVLPIAENAPQFTSVSVAGVLSGKKIENFKGGYPIETTDALQILKEKSADAFQWWEDNLFLMPPWLVFDGSACQLL